MDFKFWHNQLTDGTFTLISSSDDSKTQNNGRPGTDPTGPVHKSSSEGFLNHVNPASEYQDMNFQEQLDHLSHAVSDITMD